MHVLCRRRKMPRELIHSHLNYVVPDTAKWEQAAAFYIDRHPAVDAFVKNATLGFAVPYGEVLKSL
jgi:type III restriction enzyme